MIQAFDLDVALSIICLKKCGQGDLNMVTRELDDTIISNNTGDVTL